MRSATSTNSKFSRIAVSFLLAAIVLVELPMAALAQEALTVDIKANGQDGTVVIQNGDSWNYSWTSANATQCQITAPDSPEPGGVPLSGNDGPITPGHVWYPAVGGSTTLTLNCNDGVVSESDSVTISIVSAPPADPEVTADIDANGSDGPVTITNGDSWNYSWTSANATQCQITAPDSPEPGGVPLSGNDGPITPGHVWYPAVGGSTTLTLNCNDGTDSASDSVVINVVAGGGGGDDEDITVDIKINGQDGLVTINNGDSWNYSWTSANATQCEITAPDGTGGVTLNGSDGPISPDHIWYPEVGEVTTLTLNCNDGTDSATDQASVRVVEDDDDDDDDGGSDRSGGRRRNRANVEPGEVLGTTTTVIDYCPFLTSYLRYGSSNDTVQVMRLQAFLKVVEGHNYVTINGVFDQATLQAVHAFQQKYAGDVLSPWGINQSTGYVYITTLGKINQILCGSGIPAVPKYVPAPVTPVLDKEGGCTCPSTSKAGKEGAAAKEGEYLGSTEGVPVVGGDSGSSGTGGTVAGADTDKGQNDRSLAASIFTGPSSGTELMQGIYEFLLILIVLYIIGTVLENVLHKDVPENVRKRFLTKWITISVGLLAALIISYLAGEFILILPLLIALALSVAWLLLYPKKDTLKSKVTSLTSNGETRLMKVEEKEVKA